MEVLMTIRCLRRQVTRVVILPVGVSETSFRQDLAFNEKTSFRRFAENNLGPPPLEGYISSDSVLHRLAVELYSIVCPVLTSWEGVRNRMAANEAEWSLPLSDELPEGLSDESPGRVTREDSSEAAPSTSGTRQSGWVDRSWKALSYFSSVTQDDIDRIRRRYQIPDDVVLRIPDSDERACCPKYMGDVAFYEVDLKAGLRFPMQPFVRELLDFLGLAPGQERLPQEDPRDFVGVRRSWGTPSPSVLDRPLLNSVWQERIWRILEIEDRRYNIFIEPDLLPCHLLPWSRPQLLGINTMKLNKNRLKQMAQSGEVAAAPISLKRKKPDEGSSKRAEEAPSRPSAPIATPPVIPTAVPSGQRDPPVILVDSDLTPPTAASTINQSPLVAMDRAKGAITPQDMDEYAVAHTDDLSLLMVHSLMRGLTEAMVMARRCASVEEDLALLRAKSIADEAEMKNAKRAVMELTRERKEALGPKRLQCLISGRLRPLRTSTPVTSYLAFEAFRKQAVQRFPDLDFPDLDFSALQPYDDEDSVMDASQDQAGDEDVTSK
uniref:Uncharacterized protein n=1 Tax=Fagus sylvatica TaxID=28930 RepID=A0A2N9HUR2_FAGSY